MKTIYPDNEDPLKPRLRSNWVRLIFFVFLAGVVTVLCVIFPAVLKFVEMAAREARYLWWLILMVLLGVWLIWGYRKSAK